MYCRAVDQCAPRATVLRQVAPPLHVLLPAENRRDARLLERLVQRVPVRELGSPVGPRVADPRGEELARKPLVAHASNMPRPAELAHGDVVVEVLDLHPRSQVPVADAEVPLVPQRDAAHGPNALVVEHAKPIKQLLGEAPALRPVKQDADDERQVYCLLGLELYVLRLEDWLPQRAERRRRRLDSLVDVALVR